MRQISKKGWRKKEPGDSPYYLNDNVFQSAIDLLIEEGVLSPEGILRMFEKQGIAMARRDIEDILNLREGTLFFETSPAKVVRLRRP